MSEQPASRLGNYTPGFEPPSLDLVEKVCAFPNLYFAPTYYGLDELDASRPALFVTNHSVIGALDGTLWVSELYRRKGIFPFSLVDDFHYEVPGWRNLAEMFGFVRGSRENCSAIMKDGGSITVYPGGTRETVKRHGEAYKLTWKKRTGFARMAIEHGYDIIPVAQVGNEEAFTVLLDSDEVMQTRVGEWLKDSGLADKQFKGGEIVPPLVRGIGPTLLPRPEKQYHMFGDRIPTDRFKGDIKDDILWELREEVETKLELMITKLRIQKLEDKKSESGWRKILNSL